MSDFSRRYAPRIFIDISSIKGPNEGRVQTSLGVLTDCNIFAQMVFFIYFEGAFCLTPADNVSMMLSGLALRLLRLQVNNHRV